MKSFTAKEFSRCPAKVYEAAREDEFREVEIRHDRYKNKFVLKYVFEDFEVTNGLELARQAYQENKRLLDAGLEQSDIDQARRTLIDAELIPKDQLTEEEKHFAGIKHEDCVEFFSRGFMCRVLEKSSLMETIDSESKVGDTAYTNGYRVLLIEKAPIKGLLVNQATISSYPIRDLQTKD